MRVVLGEDLTLLQDGLIRLLTAYGMEVVAAVAPLATLDEENEILSETPQGRLQTARHRPLYIMPIIGV